jgi:hypothetical protein
MAHPQIKHEIDSQLDRLPEAMQRRVLVFVHSLVDATPHGSAGSELTRFAGQIPATDLQVMADAIEEDCEKVDQGDW